MRSLAIKASFPFALVLLYLLLQPSIFGSKFLTFASGGDQHLIVNPIMSFVSKYDQLFDPLVRIWNGDFDLYHSPITNIRYPFFFLWAGDTGGFIETSRHMFLVTQFHHVLAGLNAYILGRVLGVRPVAAFAGAMFFMLCQNNTLLSPFYWRLAATAWTPLALAGVWLVASGKSPRTGVLIGVPAIVLLVFAKSSQPLAYFAYMAFFMGLAGFLTTYQKARSTRALGGPFIGMAALVGISVLLCFPVLYPVMMHQEEYIRWTTEGSIVAGGFKVPYEATQQMAYPLNGIWNTLVPLPKMHTIGSSFVGPSAVFAAVIALFSKQHRVLAITLTVVMAYFILNGFGDALKVTRLTYMMPILSSIRQLTSHYIFVAMSATVLIAIGVDTLLAVKNAKARKTFAAVAVVIGCATVFGLLSNNDLLQEKGALGLGGVLLIASPLLFATALFFKSNRLQTYCVVAAVVAMSVPAAQIRTDRTRSLETQNVYYKLTKIQDVMAAWEAAALIKPGALVSSYVKADYPEDNRRISHYQVNSLAMYYGLKAFNVGLTPRPHFEFKQGNWIQNRPTEAIKRGTEFVLSDQDLSAIPTEKSLAVQGTYGGLTLYRVAEPNIRASLACLEKNETKDTHLLKWCDAQKNFSDVSRIEETNSSFEYAIEPNGKSYLKFWGVMNGVWRVEVDGHRVDPIRIGKDRMAVPVDIGIRQVKFIYRPNDYHYAWYIFYLGMLGWIVVIIQPRVLRSLQMKFGRRILTKD